MYNPPHPGRLLRGLYLEPLGISIAKAAAHLHVSRTTLSNVVNGRARVSARMARRLSQAAETTPEFWFNAQAQYDLWLSRKETFHVEPLRKAA